MAGTDRRRIKLGAFDRTGMQRRISAESSSAFIPNNQQSTRSKLSDVERDDAAARKLGVSAGPTQLLDSFRLDDVPGYEATPDRDADEVLDIANKGEWDYEKL